MAGPGGPWEYGWMNSQTNPTTQPVNPIWGNLLSMIPTVGPILGGIANQVISQIGINKQNQYNSPMNQVDRLRKAGLPMASMTPAGAGNQSTVPQAHLGGGIAEGSKNIGLYAQTQQTKEAIKLLNEQIRIQKAEADLKDAENKQKFGGAGTDVSGTNLTQTMMAEQNLKLALTAAAEIGNKLQSGELSNQKTKQALENQSLANANAKTLVEMGLTNEKIQTEELNQAMLEIQKEWTPKMNEAQWHKLLAEKGLIDENTTGKQLENAIQTINKRILEETSGNIVTQSDLDTSLKGIMTAAQFSEFTKTSAYNELTNKARALFSDVTKTPKEMMDGFAALLYTTITNITGGGNAAPLLGQPQK